MPLKRSGDHLRVVTAPQTKAEGRRAPTARATRPRLPAARTVEALMMSLAMALAEVAVLVEAERASPSQAATAARRRAEKRQREIRARLTVRAGKAVVGEIVRGLAVDGGLLLRAAATAAPGVRGYAVRAVLDAASVAREHGVSATSGLVLLARSARWAALANVLLDGALREPSGDRLKIAALCASQARLDTLGALQLARSADDAKRSAPVVLDDAEFKRRQAEMQERHRQEAVASGLIVSDEPADHEPEGEPRP